jgi:glyoxylate/hydroxypyruvate reductase A
MTLLYKADPVRGRRWAELFAQEAPGIELRLWPDVGDPADIRYLSAWTLEPGLLERFPNLEVLFSIGAGVDQLDLSLVPEHVIVVRLVETGLADGMAEYVAMSVLALHRNLFDYAAQQAEERWKSIPQLPAARRRVGIMGLGQMGEASLQALSVFGFALRGWSRSPRDFPGVECFHGEAQFADFIGGCDILVCLLPLTDTTRGIMDASLFALLPPGASIINAGRGGHLVEDDLLAALASGQVSRAVLDVAQVEPLPAGHAFWSHPRVVVTPHAASATDADGAGRALIANLQRHIKGGELVGRVDRNRGY